MHTETYRIKGMHCASCAVTIEATLKKVGGVRTAEVNYGTEKAKVAYDPAKTNPADLSKRIEPYGYSLVLPTAEEMGMSADEHAAHTGLHLSKEEKRAEIAAMRTELYAAVPLAAISIFMMGWDMLARFTFIAPPAPAVAELYRIILPLMAAYMILVVGRPYLLGIYRFLRYGRANMDSLVGIGTSAAFFYSLIITAFAGPLRHYVNVENTYYDVTIVVITFVTLGKYLEARAKLKTGDAIEKLLDLQAKTALIIRDGKEIEVPVGAVTHGDHVVVKPGARVPVDGVVAEGSSYVDESMVTGESMPVEKKTGNTVVAGTINTTSSFTFKATGVGAETLLARIIKMVDEAQGSRAPIQALADKISAVFVPVVLSLAAVTLGAWLIFGSPVLGFPTALSYALTSFVGVLVIACPCALGLATPTAIIVGVGNGAKEGILIKDAATLEKLHKVTMVVVDKTGTLTKGKPELVRIRNISPWSQEKTVSVLASLEQRSEHPLAHAVVTYAKEHTIPILPVSAFEVIKGRGLKGVIENTEYFAGNAGLLTELRLPFDPKELEEETARGQTPIILASKKEVIGVFMVADTVKPEAKAAVKDLHALGIRTVMLTGDHKNTASAVAAAVGIDEIAAEVLPPDKLKKIKDLQRRGFVVAMAGDGINDAPALAQADVGIAMGTGTDVAIETAGITLLHGDISKLVKAIRLSRLTMRGIKQNLFWAFAYNVVGIPLAGGLFYPLFGWLLSPVFAGLAMALSSVSVVGNSLRLKTKKV